MKARIRASQLLASGGKSTGASASASGLPVNIQSWFPGAQEKLIAFVIILVISQALFEALVTW